MLKEQLKPFTISKQSAAHKRLPSATDILENRLLHKIFILSHIPATWTPWKIAIGVLVATFLVELIWLPFGPSTYLAAGIYLIFALADWALLWWLPRSGYSFGPIGPQLFVMTVPRLGVAILGALLAWAVTIPVALLTMIILQLLGTLIYLWGGLREPFALGLSERTIQLPAWPVTAPPLRLLHLSDLHVERLTHREAHLLSLIEQANPDIIVITGDYLNLSYVNDPTARSEVRQVLAQLSAPYGVYATLGSPPVDPRDTTPSLFEGLNIHLLRDEAAILQWSDGRLLSLLGLDCEHDLDSDASALQKLIELTPAEAPRILLYHSPELMPQAQRYPLDLYLCGHTHGGQIRFPFYGAILTSSSLGKRYEVGPYVEQGTTLYISRGIGLEGMSAPRLRLLCEPEIILFTLTGC
jgi:predicted MPP superfamily phosphohydrolase